jgi:chaperonin cofactor prefoldin
MKLTLREAAETVGRNKSTVFRAIKDGRLKATQASSGVILIETSDLLDVYPQEDSSNRLKTVKRGRPVGSRKKQPDGTIPNPPQVAMLGQEIIRLEKERDELFLELSQIKARTTVDNIRIQDMAVDRERLQARITLLEKVLDDTRAESATKDGRIYVLESDKQKLNDRLDKLDNALNELMKNNKDFSKKSFLEKIFA